MSLYIRHHPQTTVSINNIYMYSGLCHKAGINYEGGWLEGKVKIEIYESKLANFKKQFFTAKKCGSIIKNENNFG